MKIGPTNFQQTFQYIPGGDPIIIFMSFENLSTPIKYDKMYNYVLNKINNKKESG